MKQQVRAGVSRWLGGLMIPVVAVAMLPPSLAHADTPTQVPIVGYDILDAPEAGSGGWSHTYDGTYTPTRTDPIQGSTVGNYSDGSGTLNDGIISSSIFETHLFFIAGRGAPAITLRLPSPTQIESIEIYGGNIGGNFFPGLINELTVGVEGAQARLATTGFGDLSSANIPFNDRLTLTGTPLAEVSTNTVVLSDFAADFSSDQISITEIKVYGAAPPSEPLGVTIDINPGDNKAVIDLSAGGTVPVAILSTATFDATTRVARTSLTFGRTGTEASLKACEKTRDINRDRLPDLVCTFETRATDLRKGDRTAVLQGLTTDSRPILGQDAVRVRW